MKKPGIFKSFIFIIFITFLAVSVILAYINYKIFQDKNEGYVYTLSSYYEVYNPSPMPAIQTLENVSTDSVKIITSVKKQSWTSVRDDGITAVSADYPVLYLPSTGKAYIKEFNIVSDDSTVMFSMEVQRQEIGDIHIIKSSLPITETQNYNIRDFCSLRWIDNSEKDTVASLLRAELRIDTCTSALSRIRLVASFIRNSTRNHPGAKLVYSWNSYSTWFIFSKGASGESSLQCNEYSQVFYLFANVAGIDTRRVAVAGWADSDGIVKFSGHHFNECYIPEQKKWAFVDITSDKAYVTNDTGDVLNTYELFVSNLSNNYNNLTVASTIYDTITYQAYKDVRQNEDYYFSKDCVIQYKFGGDRFDKWNQFVRYVYDPEPVLSLNYSNNKLYIKYLFMILNLFSFSMVVLFGITTVLMLRKKSK